MMKYTTKTEYGLICLLYIARHSGAPITIKQISGAEKYSQTYIEKILQGLRIAGIVKAAHGNQGGYELARSPSEISFKDIIDAIEGKTFQVFCDEHNRNQFVCTHYGGCEVKPIWQKARTLLDDYFESIKLDSLLKQPAEKLG